MICASVAEMLSEAVKLLKGEYTVRAIEEHKMDKAIIFCRTKVDCDNMEAYLISKGGGQRFPWLIIVYRPWDIRLLLHPTAPVLSMFFSLCLSKYLSVSLSLNLTLVLSLSVCISLVLCLNVFFLSLWIWIIHCSLLCDMALTHIEHFKWNVLFQEKERTACFPVSVSMAIVSRKRGKET